LEPVHLLLLLLHLFDETQLSGVNSTWIALEIASEKIRQQWVAGWRSWKLRATAMATRSVTSPVKTTPPPKETPVREGEKQRLVVAY
jgi:hypothetical protein